MSFWFWSNHFNILYRGILGWRLRPPVFDLENQCRGESAELYKGRYLTILEPPPFLFSSRVCLSRQVFFVQTIKYLDKNYIFPWFGSVCSHFAFLACNAGTARYQFSSRTVHIAWKTSTTRHDFPSSRHDFQQHVMNSIFLFQSLWNFASFCEYILLKRQSTATDKQTT